jgi:SAM-dependent methyltransferase
MAYWDDRRSAPEQVRTPGVPDELLDRLGQRGIGVRGQRVLDVGTGLSGLARQLVRRGCNAVGLDKSDRRVAQQRELDVAIDVRVEYVVAPAERTGLEAGSFDAVTAAQCWQWFDRAKVAREVRRLLRPGGWLAIAHFDWVALPGNAAEVTEELVGRYNPEWLASEHGGIYPEWLRDVRAAGLTDVETFSFDRDLTYSHEAWRMLVRASPPVVAALSADELARFDESLRAALAERYHDQPLSVAHRAWAVIARKP